MRNLTLLALLFACGTAAADTVIVRFESGAIGYTGCSVAVAGLDLSATGPQSGNDLAFACTRSPWTTDPGPAGNAPTTRLEVYCEEAFYPDGDSRNNCATFTGTQAYDCRVDRIDTEVAGVTWRLDCSTPVFLNGFDPD